MTHGELDTAIEHTKLPRIAAAITATILGVTMLAGCGHKEDSTNDGDRTFTPAPLPSPTSPTTHGSVSDIITGKLKPIAKQVDLAACAKVFNVDRDCDGVLNQYDLIAWGPDYGDADGDGIANAFDTQPFLGNSNVDSDGDGIPDSIDTYRGNNFADADGDGIYAAFDSNDALSTIYRQQQDIRYKQSKQIVENAMGRQIMSQILANDDEFFKNTYLNTQPNPMTTDSDGDHYPDYWDTSPHNASLNEMNDPYRPGTDEWTDDSYNGWGN